MRDDRFNSLKQEFSGVPDDAADALSSMPELIRAAFFLLSTREYKSTGLDVLKLLEPVIMELQEIDLLHDRYKEQHTGE
ncbi:hypothetical protein B5F26_08350 [Escherichia coli]|nr:hypothetical protein [Escherichia coli]EFA9244691.1 hypothetical protein [Escherichia coli]EFA9332783.1 hypothetical protein [Escherichia coli]EFH9743483.1 hypothetical protein [Escherichia coli]EHA4785380.1 hypothetical protein [Escherichia coli]